MPRPGYIHAPTVATDRTEEHIDRYLIPGEGAYEDRDPDLPFEFVGEYRHSMRMLPEVREARFSEMMDEDGYADFEILGAFTTPIPDGVENAFRTALPEIARQKDRFRIGLHPWFKRICLFQKCRTRENDRDVWSLAFLFCGEIKKDKENLGVLPEDLRDQNYDGRYDYLAGQIGEFYAPRRVEDWLEMSALADNQVKRGRLGRARMIVANRERAYAEKKSRIEQIRTEAVRYRAAQFIAASNEAYGSMQGLPIMGTDDRQAVMREGEVARFTITNKGGYRLKERKPLSREGHSAAPEGLEYRLPMHERVKYHARRLLENTRTAIPAEFPGEKIRPLPARAETTADKRELALTRAAGGENG